MASLRRTAALRALWTALRAAHKPGVPGVKERFAAVPRMVRLGVTGRYPFLDKRRLGLVVLGLVYLVSPLDFIPDMIMPLIGLGDDAVVVTWMVGSLMAEAGDFLEWERGRARTVVGQVVR